MKNSTISKILKWTVFIAGVVLIALFSLDLASESSYMKASVSKIQISQNPITTTESFGLPIRLMIPAINVNATVEYVGITTDGAMDMTKSQYNVAWFELGIRPGEDGSAVIAGHYGTWANGYGSVFDNLYQLKNGDKVYVKDDKGVITSFVVSGSQNYDPNADTSGVFTSNDGKAHLNLITCGGNWIKSSKGYSSRLVVFTDKE